MAEQRRIHYRVNRYFTPYHMMLEVAEEALARAKASEGSPLKDTVIAITFTALAVEAIANAFGDALVVDWADDFDRLKPLVKLRLIAENLQISFSRALDPWKGLASLFSLRNQIAHGKPESIETNEKLTADELARKRQAAPPASKLEKHINIAASEQWLANVQQLLDLLVENAPADIVQDVTHTGWSTSASRYPHE
jgi:hypothetical protein